jgi:hypothetical protein
LLHPRPPFAVDMTDEEKRLMQEHGKYWAGLAEIASGSRWQAIDMRRERWQQT